MVAASLSRIAEIVLRRRIVVGRCRTCQAAVYDDERHVRIHGLLQHQRCVAYRRRC